ncbi:hypothetical protein KAF44_19125 [Cupriavidus necator]|nr:hypothetical protein KAF44_19125 [Cupriavidus necator]
MELDKASLYPLALDILCSGLFGAAELIARRILSRKFRIGAACYTGCHYRAIGLPATNVLWLLSFLGCHNSARDEILTGGKVLDDAAVQFASYSLWILVISTLPALAFGIKTGSIASQIIASAWAALIFSLSLVGLRSIKGRKSSLWESLIVVCRRHRLIFAACMMAFAVAPLILGAITAYRAPLRLTPAGPLVLALVGTSALGTLIGTILIIIPRCLRLPWLGWAIGAGITAQVLLAPLSIDAENPLLRKERQEATLTNEEWETKCPTFETAPAGQVLISRVDDEILEADEIEDSGERRPESRPYFLVSAEGGGIRAAYWTAMGLGQMDVITHDEFASRVLLLSGVSGGSLGVATWLAAHEVEGLSPNERLDLMAVFLSTDFLSPLLGGFLFLDAPRVVLGQIWPAARRDHVFEKALHDRWKDLTGSSFFAQPLRRLCLRKFSHPPLVFFNATDALSGKLVSLEGANFWRQNAFNGFTNSLEFTSLRWISIAQAVSISARFPFLSPSAEVGISSSQMGLTERQRAIDEIDPESAETQEEKESLTTRKVSLQTALDNEAEWPDEVVSKVRVATLVDGGYFDNSGLTHAINAMEKFNEKALKAVGQTMKKKYADQPIYVMHFLNDPSAACLPLGANWKQGVSAAGTNFMVAANIGSLPCETSVGLLNDATSAHPFQFLTTPFEAIFSVREARAAVQRQYLIDRFFRLQYSRLPQIAPQKKQLKEFSIAQELTDMTAGPAGLLFPYSNEMWTVDKRTVNRLYDTQRKWLNVFETRDPQFDQTYAANLEAWKQEALSATERWNCAAELRISQPPLGWTLNAKDRALLRCLAARASIRAGFPPLTTPYPGGEALFSNQAPTTEFPPPEAPLPYKALR